MEGRLPSKCFRLVPDASLTAVCLLINSQLPEMSLPDKAAERRGPGGSHILGWGVRGGATLNPIRLLVFGSSTRWQQLSRVWRGSLRSLVRSRTWNSLPAKRGLCH